MRQAGHSDPWALAHPTRLFSYVAAVAVGGVAVGAVVVARMAEHQVWALVAMPGLWIVTALVIVGEVRPILISGRAKTSGITTSTAVTFAVLLVFGVPFAVILQAAAALLTGLRCRHSWWRIAFHVGQHTLSLAVAAGVLAAAGLGSVPSQPWAPSGGHVLVIAMAGLAYFVTYHVLSWLATALEDSQRFLDVVRDRIVYQAVVTSALLALSPLVAVVAAYRPWLLPLFLVPLIAVYRNDASFWEHESQSLRDGLTGLPNRELLLQRSQAALAEARRREQRMGLCLLDLDRFKEINDTLGHLTGDRLLTMVAARLQGSLRPGDTVARLGGDEFAILLPAVRDEVAARDVAVRMVAVFAEPFNLDGLVLDLEASVGIALYPDHAADVESLLQRADVAMYLAKESRGGVETYEVKRDRYTPDRLALLGDLRRALDDGEVQLHYQPKVAFVEGNIIGFEALVRWEHASRGPMSPDEFVTLAEQTGLMPRLTEYVIDAALAQVARWWQAGLTIPVAVNVTMRDIHAPDFVAMISAGLHRYEVPPSALQLEITERVLLEEPQRAAETLAGLDRLGVRLSLDDFGTGYSSLVHLRRMPVSEIKIDRSFVARLVDDEEDAAIVQSTVQLAHALGLRVVAEGVENDETWRQLDRLGCDAAQGWLLSDALPAEKATSWLRDYLPHPRRLPMRPSGVDKLRYASAAAVPVVDFS